MMRALLIALTLAGAGCGSDGGGPPDMTDNCIGVTTAVTGAHCNRDLTPVCVFEMITCVCTTNTWSCSGWRDMARHD